MAKGARTEAKYRALGEDKRLPAKGKIRRWPLGLVREIKAGAVALEAGIKADAVKDGGTGELPSAA